ncbi:MAG: type domain protein, partial [Eubacterium sp.]|nr:type domain protein [Eubacterium sp.]
KPEVDGNIISFNIKDPGQYSIEYNNDVRNTVFLFANPLETDAPDKNDKNVLYLGPGVWDMGTLTLEENQTLYIAGGAVVYGNAYSNGTKNISVKGRGIIDGSNYSGWLTPGSTAKVPVNFEHVENPEVEGVILMNPNAWTLNCLSCTDGKIDNVKIISSRQNGDGITLQSCNDFNISNSFVRSWDDSIVVKNYEGNSNNINFSNMLIWTDLAQSCEIGYETNKGNRPDSVISNIYYDKITVLHNFHKPVISIHNSDNATVQDVKYNNIVVEDASMGQGDAGANRQLIDFTIMQSGWSTTTDRGQIKNISLNNIKVLGGKSTSSRMVGFDSNHKIENVTISGLEILGEKVTSSRGAGFLLNKYVSGLELK